MYPVKLKIYGIRDFIPTEIDLGGEKDHVLIGGKNGSGKSTLVYATSFALVSGRVSIDGLRSKLIKRNEHWHARVSVLFHNPPGPARKDAPEYVELSAEVRSRTGTESRQVIYSMAGGEAEDRLEPIRRFQSRQEAWEYYKRVFDIDAEGYFMFWYQGSITEFANISDAARFERVAQMFGIDRIKEEWEEARRAMEEAEDDFNKARNFALIQQQRLRHYEKNKNELESRDRLRAEGLLLYDACYGEIKKILEKELQDLNKKIYDIEGSLKDQTAKYEEVSRNLRDLERELAGQQVLLKNAQDEFASLSGEHTALRRKIEQSEQEKQQLEIRVKDVRNKLKYIRRSKEELQEEKGRLKADLQHLQSQIDEAREQLEKLEIEKEAVNRDIGRVDDRLSRVNEKIEEYRELDSKLAPLASLSAEEARLKSRKEQDTLKIIILEDEIQSLKAKQAFLESRKSPVLIKQAEIMDRLRAKGVTCAAFGELFRVKDTNSFDIVEEMLSPLKHTVFAWHLPDDVAVEAPFYVVDLSRIEKGPGGFVQNGEAPGEAGSFLPLMEFLEFSERAKESCSGEFLEKVRRWTSGIAVDTAAAGKKDDARAKPGSLEFLGGLVLHKSMLWDRFGVRGPYDRSPAIGEEAYRKAREEVEKAILEKVGELKELKRQEKMCEDALIGLQQNIAKRREVDQNLPLLLEERGKLSNELTFMENRLKEKSQAIEELRKVDEDLKKQVTIKENMLKQVEGELSVYAEYDREYASIKRIEELEAFIAESQAQKSALDLRLKALQDAMEDARRNIRQIDGSRNEAASSMDFLEKRMNALEEEKKRLQDKKTTVEIEMEEREKEYLQIRAQYHQVIEDLKSTGRWLPVKLEEKEKNRFNLDRKLNEAKDKLEEARLRVVDEDARQKYEDYLAEYNMAKKEMDESELRFNALKRKEEQKRAEYDKAVYYRWQRTNQRFSDFMQRLHMVGNIVSVPPDEEGKNRGYRWELHVATKAGHRPEKIFPESGRIVGEGISGGERAAVSLVFALALLSDIEDRPPFYVLDEFDSALDEERKHEIFDLYREVLDRKLIIVSPKVHGDQYLNRFSKFLCVVANPGVLPNQTVSEVYEVTREGYKEAELEE